MDKVNDIRVYLTAPGETVNPEQGLLVVNVGGSKPKMYCPKCSKGAVLDHEIEKHEDDTVTLSPSLICPHSGCGAHYYVRRNKIEWL